MRRLLLIAMLVLIIVLAAAGGGLLYLNSRIGGSHLLTFINEMVLQRAGMRLDWEHASGTFLFNLIAERPTIVNTAGDTILSADRMRIRFNPWSVLDGRIELLRVEADRPIFTVNALNGEPGAESAETAPAVSSASGGGLPELLIAHVVLRDGTVQIGNEGLFKSIRNISLRSDLRMSSDGGLNLGVERLRGLVDDWGLAVTDLDGRIVFSGDRLWFIGVEARTQNGRLTANGALSFSEGTDGDLRLELDAQRLDEWGPLLGGEWTGPGPLHIRGHLRRQPWRPTFELTGEGFLAGVELDHFQVEGAYDAERLTVSIVGNGPIADRLQADVRLMTAGGAASLSVQADSLRLANRPLEMPIAIDRLDLSLESSAYDPLSGGGTVRFRALGSTIYGVESDTVSGRLKLGDLRIETASPLLAVGAGYRIEAEGWLDTDRDAVEFEVRGATVEPSQLFTLIGAKLERGTVGLEARITGRASNPDLRGSVRLEDLVQEGVRVARSDVHVSVAQVFGARIGSFGAEVDTLTIAPGIELPEAVLDGRIQGDRITLQQVGAWWDDGETSLRGNITINAGRIEANLDRGEFVHREIALSNIRGEITLLAPEGTGTFNLEARSGDGRLMMSGKRDAEKLLHLTGTLRQVELGRISRSLNWAGAPEALIEGTFSATIGQHVETLNLVAFANEPSVTGHRYRSMDIDAGYDHGIVRIDRLRISGEETEAVEISGTFHLPGAVSDVAEGLLQLDATLGAFRLGPFQSYLPGHRVQGEITGRISARGTFAEPLIDSELSLNYARLDTFRLESARMNLRYDEERLRIENGLLSTLGFNARYSGSIPMSLSLEPVRALVDTHGAISATFVGSGSPEALLQAIAGQIEQVDGEAAISLDLNGTLANPQLTGQIRLQDGLLKPRALGQTIRDIQIDIAIEESTARINQLTGRLPSRVAVRRNALSWIGDLFSKPETGEFWVTGSVALAESGSLNYDLAVRGRAMGLSDPTGSMAIVVDTDLAMRSTPGSEYPRLTGTANIREGQVDLGLVTRLIGSESSAGVEEDGRGGVELDVELDIPGRVRIVGTDITLGEDVNVEVRGDLILRRSPPGALYILGSLEAVPGRGNVYAYGHRWRVDRGEIAFGTVDEINPNLDAQLTATFQEEEVYITLTGTAREPVSRLSSDSPVLTNEGDIILFLLLGTTPGSQSGIDMRERTTNYLESALGRRAGDIIGLDTFEVRGISGVSGSGNTQISVGKYVGGQFYLHYSRFTGSQYQMGEVGAEYRLSRNFRISYTRNRFRRDYLELKWRIEY